MFHRLINKIQGLVLPHYHRLGKHYCPVCEHSVLGFTPLAPHFRAKWHEHGFDLDLSRFETINLNSYYCPLCTVSDRDRLYALYFEHLVAGQKIPPQGSFIEFAPISPLTKKIKGLLSGWDYRTADLMMSGVDDRVDICDMRSVYSSESIDMFLCSHVLEHVPDDSAALSELYRILKPGGTGILMVPIHLDLRGSREGGWELSAAERWKRFAQDDHVRLHSKQDWQDRIANAGFSLTCMSAASFGKDRCSQCGVSPDSILYVAAKPGRE